MKPPATGLSEAPTLIAAEAPPPIAPPAAELIIPIAVISSPEYSLLPKYEATPAAAQTTNGYSSPCYKLTILNI